MPRAVEVFTPNDVPTFTYVEREQRFEQRLKEALSIPKMIISLSGPSKSGKTVLVNKVLQKDNLIPVSGASIRTSDDLWRHVLTWMDAPITRDVTKTVATKVEVGGSAGGNVGIPFLAEAKADASGKLGRDSSSAVRQGFGEAGLGQVIKDIAGSEFTVFVDDFHYIPKDVQAEIGKQIKQAAESGVRICTASVPHRADDVVRSNTELRGRVTAVDTGRWSEAELEKIARQGFAQLNVDIAPKTMRRLIVESFGSPQLMQSICLNFCFENKVYETLPEQQRIEMDEKALENVLERTTTIADFSTLVSALHSGPKLRGSERKEFKFNDGSVGDVYRCVLLAMKDEPPSLTISYDQLLLRTRNVCVGDNNPIGSSVTSTLTHMTDIARSVQTAPVIEWDENVLDIVEPYFLFFLRCSPYLSGLTSPTK